MNKFVLMLAGMMAAYLIAVYAPAGSFLFIVLANLAGYIEAKIDSRFSELG